MKNNSLKTRIIAFPVAFLVVLFLGLFLHSYLKDLNHWDIGFNLHSLYYFFGFAGLFTYFFIEICLKYAPDKVAYAFLISIMIKLGCFMLLFLGDKIQLDTASMASRISVVVPLFLFLGLEAYSIYWVMKSIPETPSKND